MRLHSGPGARSASPVEAVDDNSNIPVPAPPAPLRQPRSPAASRGASPRDGQMPNGNKDFKGSGEKPRVRVQPTHYSNSNKTKFVPPGHNPPPPPQRAPRQPLRHNQNEHQDEDEDEEWGATDKKATEQRPTPKTNVGLTNIKNELPRPKHNTPNARFEKPKPKVETPPPKTETQQPKVETPSPKPVAKANGRMSANLVYETRAESKPRTPQAALVPSQFLVEKLPIGESFVLMVEQPASACACSSSQRGFVCLAMHGDYEPQFTDLLADIYDSDRTIVPKPGTTFAYFDPSDEGWYRARCLSATKCALVDGSRVADITAQSACRALASNYSDIPEFCCVLTGNVEVSMSLKCTILMKTPEGYKVSLDSATEDSYLGEGLVTRWLPEVELPATFKPVSVQDRLKQKRVEAPPTPEKKTRAIPEAKPHASPNKPQAKPKGIPEAFPEAKPKAIPEAKPQAIVDKSQKPLIPDIPRPDIVNNGRYILLHVTSLARACVRACDDEATAEFESVLQDTALYGIQSAKRLPSAPTPGEVVLCQYEGIHYRALVTRTKAAENRYKVQYAEYGNEEIVTLDKLYGCPLELSLDSRPVRASLVVLSTTQCQLTPPATEYVDKLKEETELIATIPTGGRSAPSGSLVQLSVAKNKENVNKKLQDMCTPEWKKLEEAGGDVIKSKVTLFTSVDTLELPTNREFVLEVTDFGLLEEGLVCGFEHGLTLPAHVYGPLTDKINEYCNSALCSEPYLPMIDELCLAKHEPYPQWFRAVVVDHKPGAPTATILYIDYGNVSYTVPVTDLRKCMPEFTTEPALAASAVIKDWPKTVTPEQLVRAAEFMQLDEEGRGRLPVARCRLVEEEMTYIIEVPDLIAAINK